jgi:hypothetical protein
MTSQSKGIFGNIKQINYQKCPPSPNPSPNPSPKKFEEQYDAQEVLKEKIYNYDIGKEKFIHLLHSLSNNKTIRHKTYTNYYFYQYVLSVHNKNKTAFIEKTLQQNYDPENQTHYKLTEITPVDFLKINLQNSFRFHQMIKIIRFQIKNHCLEVIIPSHSYKIPHQNIYQNLNEIQFPEGTTFIHKKIKPITSSNNTQHKKTSPPQNKKYIQTKRFIPRNRRRTYQSNKPSSPKE